MESKVHIILHIVFNTFKRRYENILFFHFLMHGVFHIFQVLGCMYTTKSIKVVFSKA